MSKALDLLRRLASGDNRGDFFISNELLKEIEAALTQPEQEPVGYLYKQMDCHGEWATIFNADKPYITWHDIKDIVPVYTTQPKREPLSNDKICSIWGMGSLGSTVDFVRAIEKAHGIGGGE
tara:strand:+ start:5066 stop:5431 length:366 start_codon:yes stop_codon:yes gene_type:complete